MGALFLGIQHQSLSITLGHLDLVRKNLRSTKNPPFQPARPLASLRSSTPSLQDSLDPTSLDCPSFIRTVSRDESLPVAITTTLTLARARVLAYQQSASFLAGQIWTSELEKESQTCVPLGDVTPCHDSARENSQPCFAHLELTPSYLFTSIVSIFLHLSLLALNKLNASSLRKRPTHECCINEGVSQSYVGKSVVSLLSIPTMGEGQIQPCTPLFNQRWWWGRSI